MSDPILLLVTDLMKKWASVVIILLLFGATAMGGCIQRDSIPRSTLTSPITSEFEHCNTTSKKSSSDPFPLELSDDTENTVFQEDSSIHLNLTAQEEANLREWVQNFTESLNKSVSKYGYDNLTVVLAMQIGNLSKLPECDNISEYGDLMGYHDNVSNLNVLLHEYKNLAEGILKQYEVQLPYLNDKEIDEFIGKVEPSSVENMIMACGLINDYNGLIESARKVELGKRDTYTEFYMRLFIVVLKIVFIKENLTYKVSYKVVGKLFWKTRLFHVIYRYGGVTALKVAMSVTHWEFRGLINKYLDEFGNNPSMVYSLISNTSDREQLEKFSESFINLVKNETVALKNITSDIADKIDNLFGSSENG
ncbi:hypothetical protein E3E35_08325 [Thermococcus sp. GR7]|uniref:hypothetical protein n=1 Tax=unclassified Thermococcus TaxID=2627626 RepID=UPI00142F6448|nr:MULTISPECIES: hypothetical protein [unclassified Thermococcus]NJE47403.1 hypothetical protein [Thermococcus sp. GR7]NJE78898.1 hypothetical protein [Thermococcus sp. GR4]